MSPPEDLSRFEERYRTISNPILVEIEQRVIGTDYGASGYTTIEQADQLGKILELTPGDVLLDIGSGPGWPGLYLAATTGCRVVATEPTLEGVAIAGQRARLDRLDAVAVVSEGDPLPLRPNSIDAVTSGDAFC